MGILFYFATTLSGAMYILGAIEAFIVVTGIHIGPYWVSIRVFSIAMLIGVLVVNYFGIKLVSRTGFIFLVVVIISIVSILIGSVIYPWTSESKGI